MRLWLRILVLLSAVLACIACGPRYFVEPPSHEAGKICTSACESQKAVCVSQSTARAEFERQSCESAKSRVISRCSGIADEKQRHNCEGGNGAGSYCASSTSPLSCNAPHARCVLSCGGTVNEVRTATGITVY
ncbi:MULTISPECIES: hypothetical protein [Stenotrophomonas]|uniref:hypothetical protein n=1 Tax=Stenotrophomonas TaxID=40323 RepID=UPI0018D47D16|nr:hypothetical protein [Stenotrophomonas sp.]MBH1509725.1 hypothetical protein [Stenotrophomonas maltophilia]